MTTTAEEDAFHLSQLLKALGAGARAVQALPLSSSSKEKQNEEESDDGDNNNVDDDDEFAFESSFPEFASALQRAHESERQVLVSVLQEIDSHTAALDYQEWDGATAAELFELSATACELLLEQVEAYTTSGASAAAATSTGSGRKQLSTWSQTARQKSQSTWSTILNNIVDMIKPQVAYQMTPAPCNGRTQVFVPAVHPEKPHALPSSSQQQQPQQPRLVEGHGYDTCHGGMKPNKQYPPSVVAPEQHVAHYYQDEIQAFEPTAAKWQVELLSAQPPPPLLANKTTEPPRLEATWIDTPQALTELSNRLAAATARGTLDWIAMDLEAHSYRTFAGMTCLMQFTFCDVVTDDTDTTTTTTDGDNATGGGDNKTDGNGDASPPLLQPRNYLIDTLKLPGKALNRALQPTLANPRVVKFLHGADSDVAWLQRDFGLYLVHLWDTGRAARALNFPSASYAHLLQRYCLYSETSSGEKVKNTLVASIVQDKQQFQLSDWRQRPLPEAMQQYAIADTHYLFHIAQNLKWELQQQQQQKQKDSAEDSLMQQVLDTSRKVSLIRYPGPPLFFPMGYTTLLATRGRRNRARNKSQQQQPTTTPLQEAVLKALWDWRDATARQQDESPPFICPNSNLTKLALALPQQGPLPGNLKLPNSDFEAAAVQVIVKSVQTFQKNNTGGDGQEDNNNDDEELQDATGSTGGGDWNEEEDATGEYDDDDDMERVGEEDEGEPLETSMQSTSSAFFKPTSSASKDRQRRGMMSPVLGTEALYKQAGWMTPQETSVAAVQATAAAATSATTSAAATTGAGSTILGRGSSKSNEDEEDDEEEEEDDPEVEDIHTTASSEGETVVTGTTPPRGVGRIDTTSIAANASLTAALDLKGAAAAAASSAYITPSSSSTNVVSTPMAASRRGGRSKQPHFVATADGFASARAAREASRSPTAIKTVGSVSVDAQDPGGLEYDVAAARHSSAQIRSELLENHQVHVLGLLSSTSASAEDRDTQFSDAAAAKRKLEKQSEQQQVSAATAGEPQQQEEAFSIPRSMREIYKISNQNRRYKKAGSPTPERGATPTNEKELAELEKAEALLRERGMDAAGFLFTTNTTATGSAPGDASSGGGGGSNKKAKNSGSGGAGDEGADNSASNNKKQNDMAFFRNIGWMAKEEADASVMSECYGQSNAAAAAAAVAVPGGQAFPVIMPGGGGIGEQAAMAMPMPQQPPPMGLGYEYAHPQHQQPPPPPPHMGAPVPSLQPPMQPQQQPMSNNPFFSGAALQGGPLAQTFRTETTKPARGSSGGNSARSSSGGGSNKSRGRSGGSANSNSGSNADRPEKRDGGRSHVYRSNR